MILLSLLASALAAPGVPVKGIQGLGEARFGTSRTGWTAPMTEMNGIVRVFVAKTPQEAEAWVTLMLEHFTKPIPAYEGTFSVPGATDLHGDGVGVMLARKGNVGVMVRSDADALLWTETMLSLVRDAGPWPSAPSLVKTAAGQWTAKANGAEHVAFKGGRLVAGQGLTWSEPPTRLVAWDSWGRAATWESEEQP